MWNNVEPYGMNNLVDHIESIFGKIHLEALTKLIYYLPSITTYVYPKYLFKVAMALAYVSLTFLKLVFLSSRQSPARRSSDVELPLPQHLNHGES